MVNRSQRQNCTLKSIIAATSERTPVGAQSKMKRVWVTYALVSLSAAVAALLLVVATILLTRGEPQYHVRVGVLEDRRPSPNSQVWIIKTVDKPSVDLFLAAHESECRTLTMEIKSHVRKGEADEATSRLNAAKFRIKFGEGSPLHLFAMEQAISRAKSLDDELKALHANIIQAHERFCERLGAELDKIAIAKAKCSIDGTAKFKDLKSPDLTAVVIPAQRSQYAIATDSLNAKLRDEMVIEPNRLPFGDVAVFRQ